MKQRQRLIPILLLGWAGCVPTRVAPPPAVPPAPPGPSTSAPAFEKTFGDIVVGSQRALGVRYKTIAIAIDPVDASSAGDIDYVLLTTAIDPGAQTALRKNTKIIAPAAVQAALKQTGFSDVKALGAGNRVMLKKDAGFLFVTALPAGNGCGYLLEFDNGRNLFIAMEGGKADNLREFVYGLRDDGKEIYAAFFRGGSGTTVELAQMISLLQPLNALIQNPSNEFSKDKAAFFEALQSDLFDGPTLVVKPGQTVPF